MFTLKIGTQKYSKYVVVCHGSVLGLKFFILYINDICNVSSNFKFILFADDTNMFYSNSDIVDLVQLTNIEL